MIVIINLSDCNDGYYQSKWLLYNDPPAMMVIVNLSHCFQWSTMKIN